MWAKNILGWFIHPELKLSAVNFARANVLASTGVIAAAVVPFFAIVFYFLGAAQLSLICLAIGLGMSIGLLALKWIGSITLAREIVILSIYAGVTWLSCLENGLRSPTIFWLILPSVLAAFLNNRRSGLYWLGITVSTVVVLYSLSIHGWLPPGVLLKDPLLFTVFSIFGLTCVMLALIYYFEIAKLEGFNQLEKAARIIEEKSAARKRVEERLAYLAHYDHLTDLPNRTLYEHLLTQAIQHAKKSGKYCALLYLDLDYFKNVNDTLGHDMGDLLLKEVAIRIKNCLRQGDTVSRLGGDEFTIILEDLKDIAHAGKVAQTILNALNPAFILNGYEVFTSASIGIAVYPINGEDVTTLAKHADMALYNAKEKGRRNYQYFNAELNAQNLSRIALENNLRNALRLNELQIYYQPQINIKTGEVVGIEAFLRWYNPTLGLITPETFIPIAEKIGLNTAISEWLLKTACAQFKKWLAMNLLNPSTKIAFNISSVQLKQESLVKIIIDALKEHGIAPLNIVFELTEAAIMQDYKHAADALEQLHQSGISIAIDDFGTGYSSLSYLKYLPVYALKIDKSFIRDLLVDKNGALIIKAIIALGHSLELQVIAEGIETAAQYNYLQKQGCDQAQGYYISAPLTADALITFLSTRKRA